MLKNTNRIITAAFVIIMVVILLFFRKCSLDIYALILAFAVAAMAAINSYRQLKKIKELKGEISEE